MTEIRPAVIGVACGIFGIGAAAAIALATPAAADSRGDSVKSPVHHNHSSSRSTRVSANVLGPVASARAPQSPQRRAAVTPRAIAQATPRAASSDIWSSLVTRIAGIFGWDPRGKLQTIYQGTHFVIPGATAIWVTSDSGDATFTADSAYDLKDADQHDWNKLAGLTFTPLEPNRDAAMVVWRLNNVTDDFFEVGPFFNDHYSYVFPTEAQIIRVQVGATFSYYVDYSGIAISYGDITVYKPYPADLIPNFWTSSRVL
ncbi:MAG: hypothetical protein ACR2JI_17620 [Mycobacterium sp.]